MKRENWEQVEILFDAALSLPENERQPWLAQQAPTKEIQAEVISLLRSYEAAQGGGFVQDKIQQAVVSFQQIASGTMQSASVGPYRLIRELGSGGMGVVFLADRTDGHYSSQVAIKLIRPGMDTEFIVARFRRERQTLARLQHTNIARLHDGGTTEGGSPYLVMEYIEGLSLMEYVREENVSIPDRIQLFLQVCSAVDYAHRNFVIHRDIKPGNILVTKQGEPKLLDFGICKLLQNEAWSGSETRAHMLTPDYASPEQTLGDVITPLSDIYSLGIVLYELLTGTLPRSFDGLSLQQIQAIAQSEKIRSPSEASGDQSAARLLRGDLDNIVLRALEREPGRRYQSAALLADDLKRYFAHEPIQARRPGKVYRTQKFLRRNAVPVAAVASVVVALSTGMFVSLREAKKANDRSQQLQVLASKLVFEVHDSIATLPGATKARAVIVKAGLESMDSLAIAVKGDVTSELDLARTFRRLGDVQGGESGANLGNSADALASYRKSLAVLDRISQDDPKDHRTELDRVILYDRIGSLQVANGQLKDAVGTLKLAFAVGGAGAIARDSEWNAALASAYVKSSEAKRSLNDWNGAYRDASQGLLLSEAVEATGTPAPAAKKVAAEACAAVGIIESHQGRLAEAAAHFRQGVSILESLLVQDPRNAAWQRELMLAYGHVADVAGNPVMENLGDRAGALTGYQKAAKIGKALHESDPSDHRATIDYGIVLSRVETAMNDADAEDKIRVQRESLAVLQEAARIDPKSVLPLIYQALELQHLGDSLRVAGQSDIAKEAYEKAVTSARLLAKDGTQTGLILFIGAGTRLARAEAALGRREQAIRTAEQARDALNGTPSASAVLILPRTYAAMGFTYAEMAKRPGHLASDRNLAISWLKRSVGAWHDAQNDKGFSAPHRREMQEAEAALEKLTPR